MRKRGYGLILVLYWLTFGVALCHLAWHYPRLPETVASHFNARGDADGWSPKPVFVGFMAIVYCLIAGLFWGVRATMRRFPVNMLNVPRRDYWLAPEREALTREMLARSTLWLGWATLVLLLGITHLSFRANDSAERSMGLTPWVLLGTYVAFSLGWLVRLLCRFLRSSAGAEPAA